ncbi:hypothetical protein KFK09_027493 [Dendrobium nobile]|uniref:Uncharacterized protein n=1 Tax=Dendrobium nobile TaxID=94219 RepID=A0A8T3A9X1_DENNO|nr:hypothetical protein KFK09_027493 [Dendrobium nobile]
MNNLWSWIDELPSSPHPPPPLPLASSSGRSILLSADPNTATDLLTFSISFNGFQASNPTKTLWVSDAIPLSSPTTHLLLLLQLVHEIIIPRLPKPDLARFLLALGPIPDTPNLLSLALLCRLFWLCAGESSADAGFLFFRSFDAALEYALDCRRSLRGFLFAAGADREERFMRSVGYVLAKWCILREFSASTDMRRLPVGCFPAYAAEVHGLWIMKGYCPVPAMARSSGDGPSATLGSPKINLKEATTRYALAHQQLELVVQLEYSICGRDPRFLKIALRVDNIRLHMARLAYGKRDDYGPATVEGHFPSRVRIRVGPEAGSVYAVGPSLGRSSGNPEYVVDSTRTVKGGLGVGVRAKARWSARVRRRSWCWEQEAEGVAAVFEGVLCDGETGTEVAVSDMRAGMRRRHIGSERAFSKAGGVVLSGDELPEVVSWRVGREMEGEKVRWRLGVRVWASHLPNEVRNGYFETRWVEWEEEVELTVVAGVGCC